MERMSPKDWAKDYRGMLRGECNRNGCRCRGYDRGLAGKKCVCGHFPGEHKREDQDTQPLQEPAAESERELLPSHPASVPASVSSEEVMTGRDHNDSDDEKPSTLSRWFTSMLTSMVTQSQGEVQEEICMLWITIPMSFVTTCSIVTHQRCL